MKKTVLREMHKTVLEFGFMFGNRIYLRRLRAKIAVPKLIRAKVAGSGTGVKR